MVKMVTTLDLVLLLRVLYVSLLFLGCLTKSLFSFAFCKKIESESISLFSSHQFHRTTNNRARVRWFSYLQKRPSHFSVIKEGERVTLVILFSSKGRNGGDCTSHSCIPLFQASGGMGRSINGAQTASFNDSLAVTEHQVAKMMEDDMGSAMQYLQGKGLCLMPISLATAISSHPRAHNPSLGPTHTADVPSSPSMSVLTAQSAMGNGGGETSVKEAASVSKP